MATVLDVGILENFSSIFVFLLVFTVLYGVMEVSNLLGKDKKGLHGMIALVGGVLILISKPAIYMINFITPWFVVLFFFIFFLIFSVRMFGASDDNVKNIIMDVRVYPWLIVFASIILIAGFASTFGQTLLEEGTGYVAPDSDSGVVLPGDIDRGSTKTTDFGGNVLNTLVHPRVLGMIAIMLIGLFTIIFLTRT